MIGMTFNDILLFTFQGNIGFLDINNKLYQSISRSHVGHILNFAVNHVHQQLVSISSDDTMKIWELDTFKQSYDFQRLNESPTAVACNSKSHEIAFGFKSGTVLIFTLVTHASKCELKTHAGRITCLAFHPDGSKLYSASIDGSLVSYDVNKNFEIIRQLTNVVYTESKLPPYAMDVDEKGHRIAVIGPASNLITVFNANTLDKV